MTKTPALVSFLLACIVAGGCAPASNGGAQRPTTPPPPAGEPGVVPPPTSTTPPAPVATGMACFTRIKKQSRPRILSITRRGGRGIPNATQQYRIGPQNFNVQGTSTDPEYGYTARKPIFTGGKYTTGSARQWKFLKNLRDPAGNPFYFERLGSCCPFKDPQGRRTGLLDVYGVVMRGTRKMILLYVSLYAPLNEPIQIPMCFKYRKDLPRLNF